MPASNGSGAIQSGGILPMLNNPGQANQSPGAGAIGTDASNVNIDPTSQPPQMKTLIYSPDVRVLIAHGNKTYDVSNDVVRCSMHRAESSAASFFMTLSNKDLRYTPKNGKPKFSRMDRIIVYMKRTDFRQVFSGYLDTVPYKQLYPGTVDFKATCTIKRLMHTWWNPANPQSSALLDQTYGNDPSTGTDGQPGATPIMGNDNGLGDMLRRILHLVGGWAYTDINIQNFPTQFFDFLTQQVTKNQSINDAAVEKFKHLLLGDDITAGPGADASHSSAAGVPGSYGPTGAAGAVSSSTNGSTVFYIQEIIAATDAAGMGPLVTDNTSSTSQQQVGATLGGSRDQSTEKAGQQLAQAATDAALANRDSDAAIIAVGVSMVETGGGGPSIHNWANPSVQGSNAYGEGYPPYPCDLDSVGLFQQRDNGAWGTLAERMNPRQSAAMFLNALKTKVPDWRNMDPGAAAQTVQQSLNSQPKYSQAINTYAKKAVQAQRSATVPGATNAVTQALGQTGAGTTVPGPNNAPSGGGAAPSTNPNLVTAAATVGATATGIQAAADPLGASKPHPDSEGAVQFMLSKCGNTPYIWGHHGPDGYDCSGLVSAAFASIGVSVPPQTNAIRAAITQIPKSQAGRGDIYEPETGHVTVLLGPPGTTLVQASTNNAPLSQQINVHAWYSENGYEWYGRPAGVSNGGEDKTSPYNPAPIAGSGTAPGALVSQGTGTTAGSDGSEENIARNLFSYMFTGQFSGDILSGLPSEKQFIEGQPLIQMVSAVCDASLRKFQSGPDGSFMAYYPDWWGLDGKPAIYQLEDIELKDVRIDFTDDALTTHVYVEGDYQEGFGDTNDLIGWMDTAGVATVEDTWLYERLIKVAPGDPETASGTQLMQRYGIRPLKKTYSMAGSHELELLLACQLFMQKWAEQFQTQISVSFMPEIFPGMRVLLVNHNLSVYVSEVSHVCDFEQGFSTNLTIMAPANPNAKALMSQVQGSNASVLNSDASGAFTDPFSNGGAGAIIPSAPGSNPVSGN